MTLSDFKKALSVAKSVDFTQADGQPVPPHFHITEVGLSHKHFMDCGGKIHTERFVNFQIWVDSDTDHRLRPLRLLQIIDMAQPLLGDEDLEVEIEYQTDTIGKYALDIREQQFALVAKQTDCLAKAVCLVPAAKPKLQMFEIASGEAAVCTPGGGCC